MIVIYVKEIGAGKGGPVYQAALADGRVLCKSRVPFFAAARVLQAEGVPADTRLEMRRHGSDRTDMHGRLGKLAGLDVREGPLPPMIRRYVAFNAKAAFPPRD
jgi:hypothetical protein